MGCAMIKERKSIIYNELIYSCMSLCCLIDGIIMEK